MPEIDKVGVAWGVLFSVMVNGAFLAILSLLHLDFQETALASIATMVAVVIVLVAFRNLFFPESKKPEGTPKETTLNDRQLDIKIAQLNALLQTYVAAIFGFFAGAVALVIFGYQFGFDLPYDTTKILVAILSFLIAGLAIIVSLFYITKMNTVLKQFRELT